MLEPEQVTEQVIQDALDVIEPRFGSGRIDWGDVWDELERVYGYDMGPTTGSPAMRLIQREIRKVVST